jgi:hypothetical protein
MNFFTVSAEAATRVSPAALSFRTAIFTSAGSASDDQDDDHADEKRPGGTPFEQFHHMCVGCFMCWHVIVAGFGLCHDLPLEMNIDFSSDSQQRRRFQDRLASTALTTLQLVLR